MSVRRSIALVAGLLTAFTVVGGSAANATIKHPMSCAPDTYYGISHNYGDIISVVGASQANYNNTGTTQLNKFTATLGGTVTFTYTANVSVSASIVAASVSDTYGITVSASLTATVGDEVSFNSPSHTTAHAEYGVWRLKTTGTYSKVQPNCTTLNYATTAYSPHYIGWYTWIS